LKPKSAVEILFRSAKADTNPVSPKGDTLPTASVVLVCILSIRRSFFAHQTLPTHFERGTWVRTSPIHLLPGIGGLTLCSSHTAQGGQNGLIYEMANFRVLQIAPGHSQKRDHSQPFPFGHSFWVSEWHPSEGIVSESGPGEGSTRKTRNPNRKPGFHTERPFTIRVG
jgi:hypothetical protein